MTIRIRPFDPRRAGLERWFQKLEAAVMQTVWQAERPITVKAAWRALQKDRAIAYNTVMTTMVRLVEKGLLSRTREGMAYVYRPTCTQAEFQQVQTVAILRALEDEE